MAARSKPDPLLTPEALASLSVRERVLLFCLASGTDWERAGVTQMLIRGVVDRDHAGAHFKLTPFGREVFAALLKPPVIGTCLFQRQLRNEPLPPLSGNVEFLSRLALGSLGVGRSHHADKLSFLARNKDDMPLLFGFRLGFRLGHQSTLGKSGHRSPHRH